MKGYVYVLSNPAMPGLLKIGYSQHGGEARAAQIYSAGTGVPMKFKVEFEMLVDMPMEIERAVHERLEEYRVSDKKEFFRCQTWEAIEAILDEYASCHDWRVCYIDEAEAIDGATELARKVKAHPFVVCSAIRHIEEEAIRKALSKQKELFKKRGIDEKLIADIPE